MISSNMSYKEKVVLLRDHNSNRSFKAFFTFAACALMVIFFNTLAHSQIRIGLSVSLTGHLVMIGQPFLEGYQLWAEDVNRRGGIAGRTVQLIFYDDCSGLEQGFMNVIRLIEKDNVHIQFGPNISSILMKSRTIAEKYRVPMIASSPVNKLYEKNFHYLFQGAIASDSEIDVLIEFWKGLGLPLKDIVVLSGDDLYYKDLSHTLKREAGKYAMKIIYQKDIDPNTMDFVRSIERMKTKNPDIVFGALDSRQALLFAQQLSEMGLPAKMNVFSSDLSTLPEDFQRTVPPLTFSLSNWEPSLKTPGNRVFLEKFKKKYGRYPSYQSAQAWSNGQVLEEVVRKVGKVDRELIRQGLSHFEVQTILNGPYKLNEQGRQVGHKPVIVQWQKGKKQIVYPVKLATKDLVFTDK